MAEQTEIKTNVASKIAAIMRDLPIVEKGLVNYKTKSGATIRYEAYSIDSIVGHLRLSMGEHKLALVPQMTGVTESKGTTLINYIFTLIDGDSNESKDCPWMQPLNSNGNISQDFGATLSYAVKNFLMRTFMISPQGDAPDLDFTPPTGTTTKTTQSKPATKKTTPAPSKPAQANGSQMTDRKKIALNSGAKYIEKIEKVKGLNVNQKPQWKAWTTIDNTPYPFILWDNHLRMLEQELMLEENALDIKDSLPLPPEKHIAVYTIWNDKYQTVMDGNISGFDASFKNPAMKTQFLNKFKDISDKELAEALTIDSLDSYKGTLRNAVETVNDWLDGKLNADLQDMDDTPGNVTPLKQQQMAGMPTVKEM